MVSDCFWAKEVSNQHANNSKLFDQWARLIFGEFPPISIFKLTKSKHIKIDKKNENDGNSQQIQRMN